MQDTAELTALEVLILDNTPITDEGLRAIAHVAPQLKYLSLQVRNSLLQPPRNGLLILL
jgi:hypothetical protein